MSSLEVITIIVTIIGFIPLYIDLIIRRRERRVHFKLHRLHSQVPKPIESKLAIRILHPDKVIEKCKVLYKDVPLPWGEIKGLLQYEKYVDVMGGVIFRVPLNAEDEDAEVIVKDGEKKLRPPIKFKDIPIGE